ncbi:DsrE family protein [Sphingomonas faeni]|uniref:DsrE family protein n=1 Tax=Sphingomonas faeni TaxID=185950 RepID=UPI003F6C1217
MSRTACALLLAVTAMMTGGESRAVTTPVHPVIPRFGGIVPMPNAAERPDPKLRYRVLFNITKAAPSPDKLNPSLEKVARFVNLLGADKVRPARGDIVAIIHGPATPLILQNAPYAARTKVAENPNIALIAALQAAGVSVQVCSQAMIGNGITPDEIVKDVVVDDSALTTLANLQLRGYALIPD